MFQIVQWPIGLQMAAMRDVLLIAAFIAIASPASSLAASSAWLETDGGRVRLVTSGVPDGQGALSGALEIDLKQGWKTYWRDPGGSGVPPSLDVSASPNIASAELSFPAPERFDDGYARWAGYKHSVTLPVTFIVKAPAEPAKIEAKIFLGVCETICIPVQGQLTVDPASDRNDAADAAVVQAALAALPLPANPEFGLFKLRSDPSMLVVEARLPDQARHADLFIASEHGYVFGIPEGQEKDGKILFSVPIQERPATAPAEGALHYTLVTDSGSVDGTLPFP
ncbi:protein-disulfide reductase DsbD domain-containing protein [Mesorhizobium sp. 1B3]|uniref:protein-disulfide reductase DsbD domain-containing protein n=1 Tax=Mesorhizobium sp. 1B3 TaxID=3243599 RepID=UPI003D95B46B